MLPPPFDTLIATDQWVHTPAEVLVLGNATESWLNGSEVDSDLPVCPVVDIIHPIRKHTNTGLRRFDGGPGFFSLSIQTKNPSVEPNDLL